ncbi:hypothetical protein DBR47_12300 [Paucibacter sp. KBW04]|uniref:DUF4755 domain-containing protein n=1 Tax=Paucibacter sp. KBW04 TaxID=2153361 RepID=UPI000F563446|nr:DUF4755 domain-containing protein [Paucibacter sp. KBW04]RQO58487.1 hypothetical protein DBR47_12300 [Paucibacter sp. KBW04]
MLYFITIPWAFMIGGTAMSLFFQPGPGKLGSLILMAVGLGPLFLQVRRNQVRKDRSDAAHAAMLACVGVVPGAGFDHSEGDSAVAINRQAKTLGLRIGEKWKAYPFADVRAWETNKERAGQVVASNLTGTMAAMGPNLRAIQDAAAATGFFVTVRDIENPKWRIAMSDSNTQARWMEILRQSINED